MTNIPLFGCQFGAIDPSLIVRALTAVASVATADDGRAFRVRPISHDATNAAIVKAITCASKEDLEINIRRSLWVGCDGRLALNVYYVLRGCEEEMGDTIPCSHAASIYELFNHAFVQITYEDGTIEYALALLGVLDNVTVDFAVETALGVGIDGATITITSNRTGEDTVLTTADGGVASTELPQGGYTYLVEAATYGDETGTLTLIRDDVDEDVTMT